MLPAQLVFVGKSGESLRVLPCFWGLACPPRPLGWHWCLWARVEWPFVQGTAPFASAAACFKALPALPFGKNYKNVYISAISPNLKEIKLYMWG